MTTLPFLSTQTLALRSRTGEADVHRGKKVSVNFGNDRFVLKS